jgi:hypothetical protein
LGKLSLKYAQSAKEFFYMRKNRFILVLSALTLTCTVVLVGCGGGSDGGAVKNPGGSTDFSFDRSEEVEDVPGGNDTGPKKIIITGLEGKQGTVVVALMSPEDELYGEGEIVNGSLTVSLASPEDEDVAWTGTGTYLVGLYFIDEDSDEDEYLYTNGKTLEELGIPEDNIEEYVEKFPLLRISGTTTKINFKKFALAGGWV